jgi:magnesium transporter
MSIHAYELTHGGHLQDVPLGDALNRWKEGRGAFWVDAGTFERTSLEPILDELGVSEFMKKRCFRVGKSTIVLAQPTATFATLPMFADDARTRRTYGAALCLPRLLLTFRAEALDDAEGMHRRIDELELDEAETSNLLCAFLIKRAAATAQVARELRDELTALGERMDEDLSGVDPAILEKLKRRVSLLHAIAEEQREAIELISHAKSAGFDPSAVAAQLGLITTLTAATERLVDRNDARIDNLIRRVQDHKAELLNRRLGLLTIISAIFLPLSLLAGIWGMNFENMPELSYAYGYQGALSLMAFVAAGSAWLLYRRGWFK